MPVKVKCPGCTKTLTVPDAARGKAVKCPKCETRVAVPLQDDQLEAGDSPKKSKKSKSKSSSEDVESSFAKLDLRKAEDREANVCPKCGYDMDLVESDDDEVVTECPNCGWDTAEGGLGEKARKKALRGPDPDKYYKGLWKNSWKFVKENYFLVFRTYGYTMGASLVLFLGIFMYLWVAMWPPRVFFALVTFIGAMVIPGWFWYLDVQVIKLTLERRDKFKRLNFDFFLASALGVKFLFWHVVFAGPLLLVLGLICWVLWKFAGLPTWGAFLIMGVGYIPIFKLFPVVLSHMTMPIETPGWMFWKIIPTAYRIYKPLFVWFVYFTVTNFPTILIAALTLYFTGPSLVEYARIMDSNSLLKRTQANYDYFSGVKNPPKDLLNPLSFKEIRLSETNDTTEFQEWQKKEGDIVHSGDVLFEYRADGSLKEYRSQIHATLESRLAKKGDKLTSGTLICKLTPSEVGDRFDLSITILMVAWLVGGFLVAWTSLFNMRTNGYFTYYFRDYLDLQVLTKQKKYVAILSRDPKDIKPKTMQDIFSEALVALIVCVAISVLFRILFANVGVIQDEEIAASIFFGILWGLRGGIFTGFSMIAKKAWEEGPMWGLMTQWFSLSLVITAFVALFFFMIGTPMPLPIRVLLSVVLLLGVLSIAASFVFVIQFWNEGGSGCLTSILSFLLMLLMIPIGILMFATNIVAPPEGWFEGDDEAPANEVQQAPENPGEEN